MSWYLYSGQRFWRQINSTQSERYQEILFDAKCPLCKLVFVWLKRFPLEISARRINFNVFRNRIPLRPVIFYHRQLLEKINIKRTVINLFSKTTQFSESRKYSYKTEHDSLECAISVESNLHSKGLISSFLCFMMMIYYFFFI